MTTARGRAERPAYTILEMLLVMTVIVMAAGLIVASVDGIREAYRLPRAADDLRGLLAGLRARAMDEAAVFEFSFEPDSSTFSVRKAGGDAGGAHAAIPETDLDAAARREFDDPEITGDHDLPAGLSLLKTDRDGSRTTAATADEEAESNRLSLRFMPDGTCTGLAFVLKDVTGGEVHFHVRGLTGAVKMARKGRDGRDVAP